MGAASSSSVVGQHVEQASKTGVCALREQKLETVSRHHYFIQLVYACTSEKSFTS